MDRIEPHHSRCSGFPKLLELDRVTTIHFATDQNRSPDEQVVYGSTNWEEILSSRSPYGSPAPLQTSKSMISKLITLPILRLAVGGSWFCSNPPLAYTEVSSLGVPLAQLWRKFWRNSTYRDLACWQQFQRSCRSQLAPRIGSIPRRCGSTTAA